MNSGQHSAFTLYRRLLGHARRYWPHIFALFVLNLVAVPISLLLPLPLQIAVDSVVGHHRVPGFLRALLPDSLLSSQRGVIFLAAGLFVFVSLAGQLQQLAVTILRAYTGERLSLGFRGLLFRHAQRLSLAYHDTQGTTDSAYRIQYDAPAIQWIAVDGIIPFITSGLTLTAMAYVTARIDWQLALVALLVAPTIFILVRVYNQRLKRRWRDVKRLESSALSIAQEGLSALRVVKAFGQEDREHDRFVHRSTEGMYARVRVSALGAGLDLLIAMTTALGTAAVLLVGMLDVQAGRLTLGELILVMGYLAQLYAPLKTISSSAAALQGSLASAERAFTLLDQAPDVREAVDATPLDRAVGTISFDNVTFAYDGDNPVLDRLTFIVVPGARVGIAGTTGAGKSTLLSLLTRFYDPMEGTILLDGLDIRQYRLTDVRNQFAIVLQDPVLFSTTISENIAYARPGAARDEIVAAATAANAHEFISRLPDGYDTLVGERGMRLSGGERQRISLARAFLKDAPILLLDEPTSSVDVRTERLIMDAMRRLMAGRTTLMVAHRLSTLELCDIVLVLETGRLAGITTQSVSDLIEALDSRKDQIAEGAAP